MTLHAGHCTTCDDAIFRFAAHGRTGEPLMLYPDPTSVYAQRQVPGGVAPGIGYCAGHAPALGADVVALDAAGARYAYWFTPAFGQHLRAWLGDHAELPEHTVDALMDQWQADCRTVEGGHG